LFNLFIVFPVSDTSELQHKIRGVRFDEETDNLVVLGAEREGSISKFLRAAVRCWWKNQIEEEENQTNADSK
tara:strand:- start:1857 stop:2072 length:216 start_codon:yes stop_codon:yes gene_type:complete